MTDNLLSDQTEFQNSIEDSITNVTNTQLLKENDDAAVIVDNTQNASCGCHEFDIGDTVTGDEKDDNTKDNTNEHIVVNNVNISTDLGVVKYVFPVDGQEDEAPKQVSTTWESIIEKIDRDTVKPLSNIDSHAHTYTTNNVTEDLSDTSVPQGSSFYSSNTSLSLIEWDPTVLIGDQPNAEMSPTWGMSSLSRPKYPVVCCRAARFAAGINKRSCNKSAMCYHRHKEVEDSCMRPEAVEVSREVWHLCASLRDYRQYYVSKELTSGYVGDQLQYNKQLVMSDHEWYMTLPCQYGQDCTDKDHKQNAIDRNFDCAARVEYIKYVNEELKNFEAMLIKEKHPDFEQKSGNRSDKKISSNIHYNIHQQPQCFNFSTQNTNIQYFNECSPTTNMAYFEVPKIPDGVPIDPLYTSINSSVATALSYSGTVESANSIMHSSIWPNPLTQYQFHPNIYSDYHSSIPSLRTVLSEENFTSPLHGAQQYQYSIGGSSNFSEVTSNCLSQGSCVSRTSSLGDTPHIHLTCHHDGTTTKQINQESRYDSICEINDENESSTDDEDMTASTRKVVSQSWLAAAAKPDCAARTIKGHLYTKRECLVNAVEQADQRKAHAAVAWSMLGDHIAREEQHEVVLGRGTGRSHNVLISKVNCYATALDIRIRIDTFERSTKKSQEEISVIFVKIGKYLNSTIDRRQQRTTLGHTNYSECPNMGAPVVCGKVYRSGLECFLDALKWNSNNIKAWSELCNSLRRSSVVNTVAINGIIYTAADCEKKVLSLTVCGYSETTGRMKNDEEQIRHNMQEYESQKLSGSQRMTSIVKNSSLNSLESVDKSWYPMSHHSRMTMPSTAGIPVVPSPLGSDLSASFLRQYKQPMGGVKYPSWGKSLPERKPIGIVPARPSPSSRKTNVKMQFANGDKEGEDEEGQEEAMQHRLLRPNVISLRKLMRPLHPPEAPNYEPYKMFPIVKCCYADAAYHGFKCKYRTRCYHLHKDHPPDSLKIMVKATLLFKHLQIKLTDEEFSMLPCEFGIHCQDEQHRQCAIDTDFNDNKRETYFVFVKSMSKYETELINYYKNNNTTNNT